MSKNGFSKLIGDLKFAVTKYSPEILTGIGIAGMVTTTVMAVRATPKALVLIEDEKRRQNHDILEAAKENGEEECNRVEKLPVKDTVKVAWKCYIPAAIVGGLSVACLVGASSVNFRRNAALATAYALSETALKEYQEAVIEEVGAKKEEAVRDAVAKKQLEKVEQTPIHTREVIITERGNQLCLDAISQRQFKSDIDFLRRVENELNRRMRDEMWISLNDFYRAIDLPESSIGDDIGWNIDKGYIDLQFSAQLTEEGVPCIVVNYTLAPSYDYR